MEYIKSSGNVSRNYVKKYKILTGKNKGQVATIHIKVASDGSKTYYITTE